MKSKTYSYTITEEDFNELSDEMKPFFKESNIDPSDTIPKWVKEWKKEKLKQIKQAQENEKHPV